MKTHLSVFQLAAALIYWLGASASAQNTVLWEAYNDYRPTEGVTHENVSGFDTRIIDDGGPLINFATGAELGASILVVSNGDGAPDDFGAITAPNEGSPADLLFRGKVDMANEGLPGLRAGSNANILLSFTGLDPTKRYNVRGSASRGGLYGDRWSVFTIGGTEAHVAGHVDGSTDKNIITKATFEAADLTEDQVALNSGDNKAGSLVGWDNIEPGPDGEFTILMEQYGGATPFGDAARGVIERYGYGLTALYLAEIESTGNLRITENPPLALAIPDGETVTLAVEGSSPEPITYQWQKVSAGGGAFADIAGATEASYTTPALTLGDHDSSYRVVLTSGGNELISGVSVIEVDGVLPSISVVEPSINFDSVYVTFSEPMKLALLANRTSYEIDGLFIDDVTVRDSFTVRLHTSQQPKSATFTLSVKDLQDLAGNAVDPVTTAEFKTFTFANEAVGLEIWENVGGGTIEDLRNFPRFPQQPDVDFSITGIDSLLVFEDGPKNTYGGRFRAWLIPDETADYHLFLRGDDNAELRISEGTQFGPLEDPDRVADASASGNAPFQEPEIDESTTEPISLVAGSKYAVEVLWKEANGFDRAQLAWRKVGDATPAEELLPIPSQFFCYFGSKSFDTDGDGLSDAYEVLNGLNASANDANGDIDGDGLSNIEEHDLGTAANLADTDADGLEDGAETGTGIYVSENDTGSDPQIADTDTDTLADGAEVSGGTDPNKGDTDGDTFADNVELALNTDPIDAASKPNVIIAVDTGAWDDATIWSNGLAPAAATDYVVVNTVTIEVSANTGTFPGNSLTLLGPGMALRANHVDTAAGNITLNDTTLKIRATNTLDGTLAMNGQILFDVQNNDFVLDSTLKGAPLLTIQGNDESLGGIQLNGTGNEYYGLTTITGTDVFANGDGTLGDRTITLVGAGLHFGYDYNSPTALLKIRGGDFRIGLDGAVTMADVVGIDENGNFIFSLFELAGPGPYTADDLTAAFQLGEGITGDGTLTLAGNTADADFDGLLDDWENASFDNLNALPQEDPDGDGLSNLAEEVGGTDPNVFDAPDVVEPPVVNPNPSDTPVISDITKDASSISLSFPTGTSFDVEYSEDLKAWSVIANGITGDYSDSNAARVGNPTGYYRGVVK